MSTHLPDPLAAVLASRFASVLFDGDAVPVLENQEPAYFTDLNLDQLVASIIDGRQEYDLEPFYYTRLTSAESVGYRHEVLHDLEDAAIAASIASFAQRLREMRKQLEQARRFHYDIQRQAGSLAAVSTYLHAVRQLRTALAEAPLSSRGLTGLARYLDDYVTSAGFSRLENDANEVKRQLGQVTYRLQILGDRVHVGRDQDEADYAAEVTGTFDRFRQGATKSHLSKLRSFVEMDHVEAAIIGIVARLHPEPFAALERFRREHADFADVTVTTFDREVQFYLSYLDFVARLRDAGLEFCYPDIAETRAPAQAQAQAQAGTEVGAGAGVVETFDPALADKLVRAHKPVVCNDFVLREGERIIVVTGPNQGGKTTFARTVAELHHLASLGLLVPGRQARIALPDEIFTHFERGENLQDLTGKLEDDLIRVRDILRAATPESVVVLNEIFTSTSVQDAAFLGSRVLEQLDDVGCVCVCVTFLDELTTVRESVVSMVSTVLPDDPASRTFKVVRRPADGRAYTEVLANKYGLTYAQVTGRICS